MISLITYIAFYLQDAQYADIDYMEDRKSFTFNTPEFENLPIYFDELKERGMKAIVILVLNLANCTASMNIEQ